MLDKDIEILYAKNLELMDSLEDLLHLETDQESRKSLIFHLESLDCILDLIEEFIDRKDETKRQLI